MSRIVAVTLTAGLLAGGLFVPGPARAGVFEDFRVPDHRLLNWVVRADGRALWGHSASSDAFGFSRRIDSRDLSGSLQSATEWVHDTDPFRTSFGLRADLRGDRSSRDSDQRSGPNALFAQTTDQSLRRNTYENLALAASHERFLAGVPLSYVLRGEATLSDGQTWDTRDARFAPGVIGYPSYIDESSTLRKDYQSSLVLVAGVGTGRVRNVTGLYEALVFEQRLMRMGLIRRPLPPAARERLAALMYTRAAYASTRDRGARDLWEAIRRILADAGEVEGDPTPQGVLRLMEPFFGNRTATDATGLPYSPITRQTGARFGVEVRDSHRRRSTHYLRNATYQYDTLPPVRSTANRIIKATQDDMAFAATAAYARPLGMRWQLDVQGSASAPARHGVSAYYQAGATATWLVTDRWLGSLAVSHSWFDEKRTAGPTAGDRADWRASAQVQYYVEDRTSLSLSVSHADHWGRGPSPDHDYGRNTQVLFGVSRRFAGRFSAPLLALAPSTPTADLAP